jgi:hypothetical protein
MLIVYQFLLLVIFLFLLIIQKGGVISTLSNALSEQLKTKDKQAFRLHTREKYAVYVPLGSAQNIWVIGNILHRSGSAC